MRHKPQWPVTHSVLIPSASNASKTILGERAGEVTPLQQISHQIRVSHYLCPGAARQHASTNSVQVLRLL